MDEKQLLENLVKGGLLSEETSQKLQKEAALMGRRVEDLIYERHAAPEEGVAQIKSSLIKIPYRKINLESINKDILANISIDTARTYKVIPIEKTKDTLIVGMVYPDDSQAQEALRFVAKQQKINLGVYLITPGDFDLVFRRYSPYKDEVEAAVRSLRLTPGRGVSHGQKLIQLEAGVAVAEEAPIIKLDRKSVV